MLDLLKRSNKSGDSLPSQPNPLVKGNVYAINMEIWNQPSIFRGGKNCSATIRFKTGNTTADHAIYADDFQELMILIEAFTKTI